MSRRLAAALLVLPVLAACSGGPSRPSNAATAGATAGYIVFKDGFTDLATGRTTPLTQVWSPYLVGPIAVRSKATGQVVYASWRDSPRPVVSRNVLEPEPQAVGQGTPSLRFYDPATGDSSLTEGAMSMAWRGEGPLAYVQSEQTLILGNQSFRGRVVVRDAPTGTAVRWTDDVDRFTVLAWAGTHLVVSRTPADLEAGGQLLLLDGPGQARVLAEGADLLAVSPDGRLLLLERDTDGQLDTYEDQVTELWDVETGRAVSTVDTSSAAPFYPSIFGTWEGDDVVLSAGDRIALFRFADRQLTLTKVMPAPLSHPWFSPDHTHVLGIATDNATAPTAYLLVDCALASSTCSDRPLDQPSTQQLQPLQNPSAPAA